MGTVWVLACMCLPGMERVGKGKGGGRRMIEVGKGGQWKGYCIGFRGRGKGVGISW